MSEIKSIETYYNGYRFRSRLEARWAVFFDAAGIKYEYEPEGFELDDGQNTFQTFIFQNMIGMLKSSHLERELLTTL